MNSIGFEPEQVKAAWRNLAADVLLLAIEEAKQKRDPKKRDAARTWLMSSGARLYVDILDINIDFQEWIMAELEND
jgi:hypothetical protein